jgi:hypothetical protein
MADLHEDLIAIVDSGCLRFLIGKIHTIDISLSIVIQLSLLLRQCHIKDLSRFSAEICENESDYRDV